MAKKEKELAEAIQEAEKSNPSLVDKIAMRPALEADPMIANATASKEIADGLKKIREVPRIPFERKNLEQQKNVTLYFCGLLPIVRRKTIHVINTVTLPMFTGAPKELSSGDIAIARDIGVVLKLNDDQLEEAITRIMKMGVKFNYIGDYAKVFKISENNPSDHYWEPNTYPLGQFCYFEAVVDLNKKFGNEAGWRNKMTPMRPLIARTPIPEGYKGVITEDMGDGWTGHWPVKPKQTEEDVKEVF